MGVWAGPAKYPKYPLFGPISCPGGVYPHIGVRNPLIPPGIWVTISWGGGLFGHFWVFWPKSLTTTIYFSGPRNPLLGFHPISDPTPGGPPFWGTSNMGVISTTDIGPRDPQESIMPLLGILGQKRGPPRPIWRRSESSLRINRTWGQDPRSRNAPFKALSGDTLLERVPQGGAQGAQLPKDSATYLLEDPGWWDGVPPVQGLQYPLLDHIELMPVWE